MATMMSAPRNRSVLGVDNPWDDDGFWTMRKFKAPRRTGQPTGGRMWRRAIRHIEARAVRAEIVQALRDIDDEIQELQREEDSWWVRDLYEDFYYDYLDMRDGMLDYDPFEEPDAGEPEWAFERSWDDLYSYEEVGGEWPTED